MSGAVHPTAGVGSAADYMVRELLRVVPGHWVTHAGGALWRAWPPDDSSAGVGVSAPSAVAAWVVGGYARPGGPGVPGMATRITVSPHGFGVDDATNIIDALRALRMLPAPRRTHWTFTEDPA